MNAFTIACLFIFSGCASITGSKNQPISVKTHTQNNEIRDARCTLTNDKGEWFTQTPGSVVVQKSTQNLLVVCHKDAYKGSSSFESKSNGGVWGNILTGGLIGYAVDSSTGAGFDYPTILDVPLT